MRDLLSRLGLVLGAAFMLAHVAITPLPRFQANYKNASAAALVVVAGGVGWLMGWLVGWALDRFAKGKKAEKEASPPEASTPGKATRKKRTGRWGPDHHS